MSIVGLSFEPWTHVCISLLEYLLQGAVGNIPEKKAIQFWGLFLMRKEKCFCASFIHTWAPRLFYHISSGAGFFSLSLVDILDQVIFHCERPPVFCRLFSSISVLYPFDAGSTPCPSKLWQSKMSPKLVNYFSNGWRFHCSVFAHISVAFFIAFPQSEVATYFLRLGPPRLGAFLMAEMVKNLPAMQQTWVWSLGWEDPLEKGMAPDSSILAWRIPWTEEPGRLQSMGSQRAIHNWTTNMHTLPHLQKGFLISLSLPFSVECPLPGALLASHGQVLACLPMWACLCTVSWRDWHHAWVFESLALSQCVAIHVPN